MISPKSKTTTLTLGTLGILAACLGPACKPDANPTSSPIVDRDAAGGVNDGSSPSDAGTNPSSDASASGACASGNPRPDQRLVDAIEQLIGSWTVDPADGPGQRTLGFGAPPGSVTSGAVDWGCRYSDDGWLDLYYDQDMVMANGQCRRDQYRLRVLKNGAPNAFGFIEGRRKGLNTDGTPNAQPEIDSSWQMQGAILDFEGQHFGPGSYVCP